ncbi:hypothetical protein D3C83_158020 [compost metagenome]
MVARTCSRIFPTGCGRVAMYESTEEVIAFFMGIECLVFQTYSTSAQYSEARCDKIGANPDKVSRCFEFNISTRG